MLRVTFFAIPNQMEIKRTEVHYFVRKPRWENNEFTRSIAASSGHSKAEIDSRRCTLVSTARRTHLPLRILGKSQFGHAGLKLTMPARSSRRPAFSLAKQAHERVWSWLTGAAYLAPEQ